MACQWCRGRHFRLRVHATSSRGERGAARERRPALARQPATTQRRRAHDSRWLESVRSFGFASTIATTCTRRASSIAKGWRIVFVGESGSGKSTLAFALARKGWTMLGDDGVVLEPLEDTILVHGMALAVADQRVARIRLFRSCAAGSPRRWQGMGGNEFAIDIPHVGHARLGALVFIRTGQHRIAHALRSIHALTALIRQSPGSCLAMRAAVSTSRRSVALRARFHRSSSSHGQTELLRIDDFFDPAA